MHVLMDIQVSPGGVGNSVSPYIAECQRIFESAGLTYSLHGYGTNVEGDWDDVLTAVKQCHETLHEMGAVRISSYLKLGTRVDRAQSMQDKIDSVQAKI